MTNIGDYVRINTQSAVYRVTALRDTQAHLVPAPERPDGARRVRGWFPLAALITVAGTHRRFAKVFRCCGCRRKIQLVVHCDRPDDPRVIDRQRLLAASNGWVIDLNGLPWCPKHKAGAAQR